MFVSAATSSDDDRCLLFCNSRKAEVVGADSSSMLSNRRAFVGLTSSADTVEIGGNAPGDGTFDSFRCCFLFCHRKRLSANFSRTHGII